MAGYSDALVVLGTAGIVVPLVRRWGLSPVLGILAPARFSAPFGLGSLSNSVPGAFLGHHRRRPQRRRHRATRHRISSFPDRSGAVVSPADDHAPAWSLVWAARRF